VVWVGGTVGECEFYGRSCCLYPVSISSRAARRRPDAEVTRYTWPLGYRVHHQCVL